MDGIKRKIGASVLGSVLKSLATSKDTQTTITGIIAGAVLAIPGLDLAALVAGDAGQVARVVCGLLVAMIGWMATKHGADGKTTLIGVVGGALYASQGSVEAVVTGVVIAALGYFTNKPAGR